MGGKRVNIDDKIRAQVKTCAGFGLSWEQISDVVGISARSLQRHCKREFQIGTSTVVVNVATGLYQTAIDRKHSGHVAAAIFFLKTRGRWRENHDRDDDKPLPPIKIEIETKPPCS